MGEIRGNERVVGEEVGGMRGEELGKVREIRVAKQRMGGEVGEMIRNDGEQERGIEGWRREVWEGKCYLVKRREGEEELGRSWERGSERRREGWGSIGMQEEQERESVGKGSLNDLINVVISYGTVFFCRAASTFTNLFWIVIILSLDCSTIWGMDFRTWSRFCEDNSMERGEVT